MKATWSTHITTVTQDRKGAYLSFAGEVYGPSFESVEDAESFVKFVGRCTGLDPRHLPDGHLEALGEAWERT